MRLHTRSYLNIAALFRCLERQVLMLELNTSYPDDGLILGTQPLIESLPFKGWEAPPGGGGGQHANIVPEIKG